MCLRIADRGWLVDLSEFLILRLGFFSGLMQMINRLLVCWLGLMQMIGRLLVYWLGLMQMIGRSRGADSRRRSSRDARRFVWERTMRS